MKLPAIFMATSALNVIAAILAVIAGQTTGAVTSAIAAFGFAVAAAIILAGRRKTNHETR